MYLIIFLSLLSSVQATECHFLKKIELAAFSKVISEGNITWSQTINYKLNQDGTLMAYPYFKRNENEDVCFFNISYESSKYSANTNIRTYPSAIIPTTPFNISTTYFENTLTGEEKGNYIVGWDVHLGDYNATNNRRLELETNSPQIKLFGIFCFGHFPKEINDNTEAYNYTLKALEPVLDCH